MTFVVHTKLAQRFQDDRGSLPTSQRQTAHKTSSAGKWLSRKAVTLALIAIGSACLSIIPLKWILREDVPRLVESVPMASAVSSHWQSAHHAVELKYDPPWRLIVPLRDQSDSLLVGVVDETDGKSCVIKVDADVPQTEVSDDIYFEAIREQMTSHMTGNKLVDERDVESHGAVFRRFRFTMRNPKWDHLFCQMIYVRRTGSHMISCQLSFPIESHLQLEIPSSLVELDRAIRLFESG